MANRCGSTATVVIIKEKTIYIAHAGDSRCVACINGQAVEITKDHRPNDLEEKKRILDAGGHIIDNRIEADIDMSRAFGDFCYKKADDPFQILTAEAHISNIEINEELEFLVLASDGIWNTMESPDVIKYIRQRIEDKSLQLEDLIGELFLELLPEEITPDGSGCDNMTAILINFNNIQENKTNMAVSFRDIYEYRYPPVKKNSLPNKKLSDENNSQMCQENIYIPKNKDEQKEYSEANNFHNFKQFDVSSYSPEKGKNTQLDYVERIPTFKFQQLQTLSENNLAPTMAEQTVQQDINESKNCKESMPLQRTERILTYNPQQPYISNASETCTPTPALQAVQRERNVSQIYKESYLLEHANKMANFLESLKNLENTFQEAQNKLLELKNEVFQEMMRFSLHLKLLYSARPSEPVAVIDISSDDEVAGATSFVQHPVEKEKAVSQTIDSKAAHSHSMQDNPSHMDLKRDAVKPCGQTVEVSQVKKTVQKSPTVKNQVQPAPDTVEDTQAEKTVMNSPTMKNVMEPAPDSVDHVSEEVKKSNQSVKQDKIEETDMKTSTMNTETNQDDCKNKLTTAQSIQNEKEVYRMNEK